MTRKRHPHKYEELLPEEFYEELKRAPIAYWGCGAMEEHGLHNPLGADAYVAYETCLRAAEISGGIVFPPVPFAPAGVPGFSRQELRSRTGSTCPAPGGSRRARSPRNSRIYPRRSSTASPPPTRRWATGCSIWLPSGWPSSRRKC